MVMLQDTYDILLTNYEEHLSSGSRKLGEL